MNPTARGSETRPRLWVYLSPRFHIEAVRGMRRTSHLVLMLLMVALERSDGLCSKAILLLSLSLMKTT